MICEAQEVEGLVAVAQGLCRGCHPGVSWGCSYLRAGPVLQGSLQVLPFRGY